MGYVRLMHIRMYHIIKDQEDILVILDQEDKRVKWDTKDWRETKVPAIYMCGVCVITWAKGICLMYIPEGEGIASYISGKSWLLIL